MRPQPFDVIHEENRRIMKINTTLCGKENKGKWTCSESIPGPDGSPITRYLQEDGTWDKDCTYYFENESEVRSTLAIGHQPDFSLSPMDLHNRSIIREDIQNHNWGWDV